MKTKYIIKLILCFFVITGIVSLFSSVQAEEYNYYPGTIYYEKDGVIIENILAAGLKTEIANGTLPAVSPNGKYLVYYDTSNYPVIYNIAKGTKKTLKDLESTPANQPVWSPNSKYFTIESHTSTNNQETIINKSGKVIGTFETIGDFYWWNSKKIIYTALITPEELNSSSPYRPRGDAGGAWYGIAKLAIKNNQELSTTILMIPDEFTDYQLFDIKNQKIRFSKTVVSEYNGWYNTNEQTVTYEKINKNGYNLKNIDQPKTWEEKISEDLPAEYTNYSIRDFGGSAGNHWRLFTLQEDSDSDTEIYITRLKMPETMFRVDAGEFPSW